MIILVYKDPYDKRFIELLKGHHIVIDTKSSIPVIQECKTISFKGRLV